MQHDTTPPPPWTRESNLKCLLLGYWRAPDDTQEEDDAFNYLCEAIEEAMTEEQRDRWHEWNLKATQDEIVVNGLDALGLETLQQEAWEEFNRE